MRPTLNLIATSCLLGVSALALPAQTKVSKIIQDKPKYVSEYFSKTEVGPEVLKAIEKLPMQFKKFNSINVSFNVTVETNGQKWDEKSVCKYTSLGSGLVREESEASKNGIAYNGFYCLSFLGLVPLRTQAVPYTRTFASPMFEMRTLDPIPESMAKPAKGTDFKITGKLVLRGQLFSGRAREFVFTVQDIMPASKLAPALAGDAILIDRESKLDSVTYGHQVFYYLPDYGFAFVTKETDPRNVYTYTIEKLSLDDAPAA